MAKAKVDVIEVAVFTAAVYAATIAIQIYQPATGGYFNLGEAVIYLAALISGPLTAAIAGGVGASLADLSTGYSIFAPATLVIKFIEGYVAGFLVMKVKKTKASLAVLVGVIYTGLLLFFTFNYWSGKIFYGPEEYLGIPIKSPELYIPVYIWVVIVLVIGGLVTYALYRKLVYGSEAILLLLAGSIMVLGYFLYEYFISNPLTGRPSEAAIVEVPVNIGQAVIGASLAIPLAGWLRRAGYARETTRS